MSRVSELLHEMLSYLEKIEPAIAGSFRAPAAKEDIEWFASSIHQSIPRDLIDFWETRDGQGLNYSNGIFDGDFLFLSVEGALVDWLNKKEVFGAGGDWTTMETTPEVQSEVWLPAWIPFAWAPTGDTLCVDMAPTEAGKKGQVIMTTVAGCFRTRISASLVEWFEELIEDFRSGRFAASSEYDGYIIHDRSES